MDIINEAQYEFRQKIGNYLEQCVHNPQSLSLEQLRNILPISLRDLAWMIAICEGNNTDALIINLFVSSLFISFVLKEYENGVKVNGVGPCFLLINLKIRQKARCYPIFLKTVV